MIEDGGDDVVAVLGVAGTDAEFDEGGAVAESVGRGGVVLNVGGREEIELDAVEGDDASATVVAEADGMGSTGGGLTGDGVAVVLR